MKEDLLKKAMREMGARGGKRSLETMTPEERADRAKKAAAKSAEVRSKKARATFTRHMQEIGKLGGRPKGSTKKSKTKKTEGR